MLATIVSTGHGTPHSERTERHVASIYSERALPCFTYSASARQACSPMCRGLPSPASLARACEVTRARAEVVDGGCGRLV